MISSSFGERSGFSRTGGTGMRFRIASAITPAVSPRYGRTPVDISYSTAPNENKSVRASTSSPRTCSGDIYVSVATGMPLSKDRGTLAQAVVKGAATKDFFGTAYGQAGETFEGFRLGADNVHR